MRAMGENLHRIGIGVTALALRRQERFCPTTIELPKVAVRYVNMMKINLLG